MKKIVSLFSVLALLCSLFTPAMAAEVNEVRVDLGNGFYMVETLQKLPDSRTGDIVGGKRTATVYYGSTMVGEATLYARFDISGASAVATDAVISGSGMNGWTYSRGTTHISGNTASGTGYFTNGTQTKSCTLSISCDPAGNLS